MDAQSDSSASKEVLSRHREPVKFAGVFDIGTLRREMPWLALLGVFLIIFGIIALLLYWD